MVSNRVVFTVGDVKPNDIKPVQLCNIFFPNRHATLRYHLAENDLAAKLEHQDLSKLVFTGPSTANQFGGYTPEQFANQVNRFFPSPAALPKKTHENYQRIFEANQNIEQRKLLVTDVYILNSFFGVVNKSHPPLAQEIADQLYKKGFMNVKVHNVAIPEHSKGYHVDLGIRNDDLSCIAQLSHPSKNGDVFRFTTNPDPVKELEKPQHIFWPMQVRAERQARHISDAHRRVLQELEYEYKIVGKKWDKKYKLVANHLQIMIAQLRAASEDEWFILFNQSRGFFASYLAFGVASPIPGNQVKLMLQQLYEREVTQQALDRQRAVQWPVTGVIPSSTPMLPVVQPLDKAKEEATMEVVDPQDEGQHAQLISSNPVGLYSQEFKGLLSPATPAPESVTHHHTHENLLRSIRLQHAALEQANKALKRSCLARLFTDKIAVKSAKIDALQTLLETKSYAELQKKTAEAKNNQSVMAGFFSRKTRHLLEGIVPTPPLGNKPTK
jgi:hypothetical protein